MNSLRRAINISSKNPTNISLDEYRDALSFVKVSELKYTDIYTNKFSYLFELRMYILMRSFIIFFVASILFTSIFTASPTFRSPFMEFPLPDWLWPWNFLSRDFFLALVKDSLLPMRAEDIDIYIKLCSYLSFIWILWAVSMIFINIVISGGYDVSKPLVVVLCITALSVAASAYPAFRSSSIGPSVHDSLDLISIKKAFLISFTYFSIVFSVIMLLVQFKSRPKVCDAEDGGG